MAKALRTLVICMGGGVATCAVTGAAEFRRVDLSMCRVDLSLPKIINIFNYNLIGLDKTRI